TSTAASEPGSWREVLRMSRGAITRVGLHFVRERANVWLRFGRPLRVLVVSRERRIAEFVAGQVFARIRWQGNEYGTTLLQLLMLSIAGVMAVAAGLLWRPSLRIIYNATESAPLGWYWVQPTTSLEVGDYVVAALPTPFEVMAVERRYLARRVPLLKPIA